MKRIVDCCWAHLNAIREVRALTDPLPVLVAATLLALLLMLWSSASTRREPTAPRDPEPAALLSVTRTNSPTFRRHYPHGQLKADVHTLVNMMRFALTPELSDPTNASAARV